MTTRAAALASQDADLDAAHVALLASVEGGTLGDVERSADAVHALVSESMGWRGRSRYDDGRDLASLARILGAGRIWSPS